MGASGTKKAVKPELTQEQIEHLKSRTRMSEEEIRKWFSKLNSLFLFHSLFRGFL
jgi:hypothetical protein